MVVKIKKQNIENMCVKKVKHKFQDYENCLKATQRENKIKQLKKITLM